MFCDQFRSVLGNFYYTFTTVHQVVKHLRKWTRYLPVSMKFSSLILYRASQQYFVQCKWRKCKRTNVNCPCIEIWKINKNSESCNDKLSSIKKQGTEEPISVVYARKYVFKINRWTNKYFSLSPAFCVNRIWESCNYQNILTYATLYHIKLIDTFVYLINRFDYFSSFAPLLFIFDN